MAHAAEILREAADLAGDHRRILRDHRHYSDPMADTIYAGRRKEICPICRGKLLRPEYQPLRILGVNYGDLLTKPVEELSQIMKAHSNALPAEEKSFQRCL